MYEGESCSPPLSPSLPLRQAGYSARRLTRIGKAFRAGCEEPAHSLEGIGKLHYEAVVRMILLGTWEELAEVWGLVFVSAATYTGSVNGVMALH